MHCRKQDEFWGNLHTINYALEQEFNSLLSTSYAGDTGESQQVAAGLEDHLDLLSLADQVPETEDLMDQEDDAPIVRLINALSLRQPCWSQISILKPLRKAISSFTGRWSIT